MRVHKYWLDYDLAAFAFLMIGKRPRRRQPTGPRLEEHHRSLGDFATIEGTRPTQCEIKKATQGETLSGAFRLPTQHPSPVRSGRQSRDRRSQAC